MLSVLHCSGHHRIVAYMRVILSKNKLTKFMCLVIDRSSLLQSCQSCACRRQRRILLCQCCLHFYHCDNLRHLYCLPFRVLSSIALAACISALKFFANLLHFRQRPPFLSKALFSFSERFSTALNSHSFLQQPSTFSNVMPALPFFSYITTTFEQITRVTSVLC